MTDEQTATDWDTIVQHSVYPDGAPKPRTACIEHQAEYGASVADPNAWRHDRANIARVEDALIDFMQVKAASTHAATIRLIDQCKGDFDGAIEAIEKVAADPQARKYAQSDRATPYTILPTIQTAWARAHTEKPNETVLERVTRETEKRRSKAPRRGTVGALLAQMRADGLLQ
jgi:hypothetical protein